MYSLSESIWRGDLSHLCWSSLNISHRKDSMREFRSSKTGMITNRISVDFGSGNSIPASGNRSWRSCGIVCNRSWRKSVSSMNSSINSRSIVLYSNSNDVYYPAMVNHSGRLVRIDTGSSPCLGTLRFHRWSFQCLGFLVREEYDERILDWIGLLLSICRPMPTSIIYRLSLYHQCKTNSSTIADHGHILIVELFWINKGWQLSGLAKPWCSTMPIVRIWLTIDLGKEVFLSRIHFELHFLWYDHLPISYQDIKSEGVIKRIVLDTSVSLLIEASITKEWWSTDVDRYLIM